MLQKTLFADGVKTFYSWLELTLIYTSRAAASSLAKTKGISINEIMDSAGWSSEKSFSRHYNKIVEQEFNIGQEILKIM